MTRGIDGGAVVPGGRGMTRGIDGGAVVPGDAE
jgi:hypothetical protein